MAPDPKVSKAFKAMRNLGISENKVKPVLKRLLKLYEKNWELIEEENYRVLADAIFDEEDTKVHLPSLPLIVWFVVFTIFYYSSTLGCLFNSFFFLIYFKSGVRTEET